jgi:hypothetical protein
MTQNTSRGLTMNIRCGEVVHATVSLLNSSALCGELPAPNTLYTDDIELTNDPITCWRCEEILDDDEEAGNYDRDPREPW